MHITAYRKVPSGAQFTHAATSKPDAKVLLLAGAELRIERDLPPVEVPLEGDLIWVCVFVFYKMITGRNNVKINHVIPKKMYVPAIKSLKLDVEGFKNSQTEQSSPSSPCIQHRQL